MGKIRESINQMREKCVELHKSGDGYRGLRLCWRRGQSKEMGPEQETGPEQVTGTEQETWPKQEAGPE